MGKRVLIVDDEFGLAEVVSELLAEKGYEVRCAINGELGLAQMREQRPDLVLLDMMMPILDGPGFLRELQRVPDLATVPVILMTALPQPIPPDVAPMARAVLPKPFRPGVLFAAVRAALGE